VDAYSPERGDSVFVTKKIYPFVGSVWQSPKKVSQIYAL
jgi:hypothetical protein